MMWSHNPGGFHFCLRLRISQPPSAENTRLLAIDDVSGVNTARSVVRSKKVLLYILSLTVTVNMCISAISALWAVKGKIK